MPQRLHRRATRGSNCSAVSQSATTSGSRKRRSPSTVIATSFVFLAWADARYSTGEVLSLAGFRLTSR
jgi:hypothetical protein